MLNLIAMFIVGTMFGICLTMIIVLRYGWRDYPTDDDLCEMEAEYEATYGKENE